MTQNCQRDYPVQFFGAKMFHQQIGQGIGILLRFSKYYMFTD